MNQLPSMNPAVHQVLSVLVTVLLASAVVFALPFCFILRDGLGPDATTSGGFEAIVRTLKSFHIGPIILVLSIAALCLRFGVRQDSSKNGIHPISLTVLAIILLAGLSVGAMTLLFAG